MLTVVFLDIYIFRWSAQLHVSFVCQTPYADNDLAGPSRSISHHLTAGFVALLLNPPLLPRIAYYSFSPLPSPTFCSANLCTGVSIVLRLRSMEQVKDQLPWMCGTFGTIALDMTLFYQTVTLGHENPVGEGHHHHHHNHHNQHAQGHGHGHCHGHGHSHVHGNRHASGGAAVADGRCERACGAGSGGGGGGKLADLEAPLLGPVLQVSVDADGAHATVEQADLGAIVR
jgi:hypothetical protein